MPTEKLSMRKIKEVLRLHHEQSLGNREIARRLKMSPASVSNYLIRAEAVGLTWPLSDEWTEDKIYSELFPNNKKNLKCSHPDLGIIHKELKRKGVTLLLLWHEYRDLYPKGYSYSRYCGLYQEFIGTLKPGMRLTHHAGEKLFVDYSGLTVQWINKDTGEAHKAQIFVAVLGASNYTFISLCYRMPSRNNLNLFFYILVSVRLLQPRIIVLVLPKFGLYICHIKRINKDLIWNTPTERDYESRKKK